MENEKDVSSHENIDEQYPNEKLIQGHSSTKVAKFMGVAILIIIVLIAIVVSLNLIPPSSSSHRPAPYPSTAGLRLKR